MSGRGGGGGGGALAKGRRDKPHAWTLDSEPDAEIPFVFDVWVPGDAGGEGGDRGADVPIAPVLWSFETPWTTDNMSWPTGFSASQEIFRSFRDFWTPKVHGVRPTHVSIAGGRWMVTPDKQEAFFAKLVEHAARRMPFHMVEQVGDDPNELMRVYFDLDMKHVRRVSTSQVIVVARAIQDVVKGLFQRSFQPRFWPPAAGEPVTGRDDFEVTDPADVARIYRMVVLGAPYKLVKKEDKSAGPGGTPKTINLIKTGIHVVFPNLYATPVEQKTISRVVAQYMIRVFGIRAPPANPWSDVVDTSVYDGGLRMTFANKSEPCSCKRQREVAKRKRKAAEEEGKSLDPGGVRAIVCAKCRSTGFVDSGRPYYPICVIDGDGARNAEREATYAKVYPGPDGRIATKDECMPAFAAVFEDTMIRKSPTRAELRVLPQLLAPLPPQAEEALDEAGVTKGMEEERALDAVYAVRKAKSRSERRVARPRKTDLVSIGKENLIKAIEREIQMAGDGMWRDVMVKSIDQSKSTGTVLVKAVNMGVGVHYCLNVGKCHTSQQVWWMITRDGFIHQYCWKRTDNIDQSVSRPPVSCSDFKSVGFQLKSRDLERQLFEGESEDGIAKKRLASLAESRDYHMVHVRQRVRHMLEAAVGPEDDDDDDGGEEGAGAGAGAGAGGARSDGWSVGGRSETTRSVGADSVSAHSTGHERPRPPATLAGLHPKAKSVPEKMSRSALLHRDEEGTLLRPNLGVGGARWETETHIPEIRLGRANLLRSFEKVGRIYGTRVRDISGDDGSSVRSSGKSSSGEGGGGGGGSSARAWAITNPTEGCDGSGIGTRGAGVTDATFLDPPAPPPPSSSSLGGAPPMHRTMSAGTVSAATPRASAAEVVELLTRPPDTSEMKMLHEALHERAAGTPEDEATQLLCDMLSNIAGVVADAVVAPFAPGQVIPDTQLSQWFTRMRDLVSVSQRKARAKRFAASSGAARGHTHQSLPGLAGHKAPRSRPTAGAPQFFESAASPPSAAARTTTARVSSTSSTSTSRTLPHAKRKKESTAVTAATNAANQKSKPTSVMDTFLNL